MQMPLVPLGNFETTTLGGTKRVNIFNLTKAGAVLIGNILCHYDNPHEEDIVECLRNAGLPPTAYPAVDMNDPRYHVPNTIPMGRFEVSFVSQRQNNNNEGIFPKISVDFFINERVPGSTEETRLVKKISAKFSIKPQYLICRLQMNLRRFNFKKRCHRRRILLLTTCILAKESRKLITEGEGKLTLASLFNDPRGGVFTECIAKWILPCTSK